MNDILAIIVVCVLSDTLVKELPTHFDQDTDYESFINACYQGKAESQAVNKSMATEWYQQKNQSFATERQNATDFFTEGSFCQSAQNMPLMGFGQSNVDSYAVFRELHNPEFIFADAYLMFEKIMELGVKDLYYVGEPPKIIDNYDDYLSMSELERSRL